VSHEGARPAGEFLLYGAAEGEARVSVYFEGETAWLIQKTTAEIAASADASKPHMGLTTPA
jgi:hypothetical protein